jgi:GAF domain-containing protein
MNDKTTAESRVAILERDMAAERKARQALAESSVRLAALLNLSELLTAIVESATKLLDAETGSILLLDESTGELTFEVATGESGEVIKQMRVPSNLGIAGWVLQHDVPLIVDDVVNDPRFYNQIDLTHGFTTRSMLAVPLKFRDNVTGVMEVINKLHEATFDERDRELAQALAAQAAVAVDNARLYRKLADALVESRLSNRL